MPLSPSLTLSLGEVTTRPFTVVAVVPVDDDVAPAAVVVVAGTAVVTALGGVVGAVAATLLPTVVLVTALLSELLLGLSLLHAPSHRAPTAHAMSGIRRFTMPRH